MAIRIGVAMMNRYEEAFDELKEVLYLPDKYLEKRLNILQELVEKATPKKPVEEFLLNVKRCPNCSNLINEYEGLAGCPYCLQALNWSEEE